MFDKIKKIITKNISLIEKTFYFFIFFGILDYVFSINEKIKPKFTISENIINVIYIFFLKIVIIGIIFFGTLLLYYYFFIKNNNINKNNHKKILFIILFIIIFGFMKYFIQCPKELNNANCPELCVINNKIYKGYRMPAPCPFRVSSNMLVDCVECNLKEIEKTPENIKKLVILNINYIFKIILIVLLFGIGFFSLFGIIYFIFYLFGSELKKEKMRKILSNKYIKIYFIASIFYLFFILINVLIFFLKR